MAVDAYQSLVNFILSILPPNDKKAEEFLNDPEGVMTDAGLNSLNFADVNVSQAIGEACSTAGVPYSPPSSGGGGGGGSQSFHDVAQQVQVATTVVYQTNETNIYNEDNSQTTNNLTDIDILGNNTGDIDVQNETDQVQVAGNNEGAIGDANEVAHVDINAGGGSGGTADASGTGGTGGAGTGGTGGTANATTGTADGGTATGGAGGAGGGYPDSPGGPGGAATGGAGGSTGDADADADAYGQGGNADGFGGTADASGGAGGSVGPININFGDDTTETGPGDQDIDQPPYEQQTWTPLSTHAYAAPPSQSDSDPADASA
jgi:hypothetical protein